MSKALTDLLVTIEAGEWDFRPNAPARQVFPYKSASADDLGLTAREAFEGSLDAAAELHEAMLPEYGRAVDATVPESGIEVSLHKDGEEKFTGDHQPSEARAWLIAILKALIAKDQAND